MARVGAFDELLVECPVSQKRCRLEKVVGKGCTPTELGGYLPKALAIVR
jgi:hypothetical protein